MKDILVLEDASSERERMVKLLLDAGYTVQGCESVQQAEEAVFAEEFRLAILDIGLGDKSGSFFFGALKKLKSPPGVIIFTGNQSLNMKQRFMDEGAMDYIVKGSREARSENFLARISELIGEPGEV